MQSAPTPAPLVLGPEHGDHVQVGAMGVRFMLGGDTTGDRVAIVEHPIEPRSLAAPMHWHEHEDEYSYVLEGEVGVQVGDEVVIGRPGDLVFKPRGVPHAFWNPGETPARLLEVISPAPFAEYFREIAHVMPPQVEQPDFEALGRIMEKYGLRMDFESMPRLIAEHGLVDPLAND